jgi:hypothetical protein
LSSICWRNEARENVRTGNEVHGAQQNLHIGEWLVALWHIRQRGTLSGNTMTNPQMTMHV